MDKIEVIEVFCNLQKVGRLALTDDNLCAFEYDAEFLKNGFSLSPYFLPLKSGLFIAKREQMQAQISNITTLTKK